MAIGMVGVNDSNGVTLSVGRTRPGRRHCRRRRHRGRHRRKRDFRRQHRSRRTRNRTRARRHRRRHRFGRTPRHNFSKTHRRQRGGDFSGVLTDFVGRDRSHLSALGQRASNGHNNHNNHHDWGRSSTASWTTSSETPLF